MLCPSCRTELSLSQKPGFRDDCPRCGADLHCCLACSFYDPGAYNDCRETQASRVVDKERANFCEYFQMGGPGASQAPVMDDAKKKLEALFKKS